MANPTRFPAGLSTFKPQNNMNTFPSVPNPNQLSMVNEFVPYRSGDWTLTQTNGSLAALAWSNGGVTFATTGSTAADKIVAGLTGTAFQVVKGNKLWFSTTLAIPSANSNVNLYAGMGNNADITAATDAIYFVKASTGTSVNLVIRKGSTNTTIQNVADLAEPSGIYNDANSVPGTLTATGSAGAYTSIAVGTPGSGYAYAPLVQATGATGSGAAGFVQLGSGSLYDPVLTAVGSSYTTYLFTVTPFITLSFYFDGVDTLYVGVNGKNVASVGSKGAVTLAAGGTVDNSVSQNGSYYVSTQLSTLISPVQPKPGSFYNLAPLVPMTASLGFVNTTAAARAVYVDSILAGNEYN